MLCCALPVTVRASQLRRWAGRAQPRVCHPVADASSLLRQLRTGHRVRLQRSRGNGVLAAVPR
eukprot:5738451-Prymnesium_polylepis.1